MLIQERTYALVRKIAFGILLCAFLVAAPVMVFYSLGYKFDRLSGRFQRTGALCIKTTPKDVEVVVNGRLLKSGTPYIVRELLPQTCKVRIAKDGYYTYETAMHIHSSLVAEMDVTLIPTMKYVEQIKSDLPIVSFFIIERLFGKQILAFTTKGLYIMNTDFDNVRHIGTLDMSEETMRSMSGVIEGKTMFVFWSTSSIWLLDMPRILAASQPVHVQGVYTSKEGISEVFFALKERYLIVHDGLSVVAVDVKNEQAQFPIMDLRSVHSSIFYDSNAEMLYIKDKLTANAPFYLSKINLSKVVHEQN